MFNGKLWRNLARLVEHVNKIDRRLSDVEADVDKIKKERSGFTAACERGERQSYRSWCAKRCADTCKHIGLDWPCLCGAEDRLRFYVLRTNHRTPMFNVVDRRDAAVIAFFGSHTRSIGTSEQRAEQYAAFLNSLEK